MPRGSLALAAEALARSGDAATRGTAAATKASRDQYGTVRAVESNGSTSYEVMLDGAEGYAPCTRMVAVHHGDRVLCHIVNHRVVVIANVTTPSVTETEHAYVKDIAEEADQLLDGVAEAAATADKTVAEIIADANTASGLVSGMQSAAQAAGTTLAQIVTDADAAAGTLADMQAAAEAADTTLTGIYQDAEDAKAGAQLANASANAALVSLSEAQDVIGVVNWITQHGTYSLTQDAAVDASKVYYSRTGAGTQADPYVYAPVAEPTASGLSSYYELSIDQALSQFVASHLALTDEGLLVLKDGSSWKTLMKSDGWEIRDASNATAMSIGASGVDFSAGRTWHIGSNDAYVLYTPASGNDPASLVIGGSNVQLGDSRTLAELMAQVDGTLIYDHTCEIVQSDGTVAGETSGEDVAVFTARLYKGGVDVAGTSGYPASQFSWYLRSEDDVEGTLALSGSLTFRMRLAEVGYGTHVIGKFATLEQADLLDEDDEPLTTSDDEQLVVRTPAGDSVRVSDLSVETTLYPTEKLMVVGASDEHLVTVSTLQEAIAPSIEGVTLIGNKDFPDLGIFVDADMSVTGSGGDYPASDGYAMDNADILAIFNMAMAS